MQKEKIFTKDFTIIFIILFTCCLGFFQLMPVLPLFAANVIKLNNVRIGILVASYSIASLVARPFIGYLMDNFSKVKVLSLNLILFSISLFSLSFTHDKLILILLRIVQGCCFATLTVSATTIAMGLIPTKRKGEGIGIYSIAMPTALIIGPAMGLEIVKLKNNYNMVFYLGALLIFISYCISLLLKNNELNIIKKPLSLSPSKLYDVKVLGIAFLQFVYYFVYSSNISYLPLYVEKAYGGSSSYYFIVFAVSLVTIRIFLRNLFDKYGPTPPVIIGFISSTIGLLMLSHVNSTLILILVALFYGISGAFIIPVVSAMTMNITEQSNRGRANATVFTAIDLGSGAGAFVTGFLLDYIDYATIYKYFAFIPAIPMLYYLFYERKLYFKRVIKD